ncbi:MAG TPA: hypothetical protein VI815_02905 [Candidatus Nanoarchaeia archaeon]|nr:hypothetical protein [Candidatus Nanoarchaeia archaeon]
MLSSVLIVASFLTSYAKDISDDTKIIVATLVLCTLAILHNRGYHE